MNLLRGAARVYMLFFSVDVVCAVNQKKDDKKSLPKHNIDNRYHNKIIRKYPSSPVQILCI